MPGIAAWRIQQFFANAGWHVAEAMYGRGLRAAFARDGGDALRAHIDDMPNEAYQALLSRRGPDLRKAFLDGADPAVARALRDVDDAHLPALLGDPGGHDHEVLLDAFRSCDQTEGRPSVVFAYTIKGWDLPMAGDPLNHSALMTATQVDELRDRLGLTADTEWERFDDDSDAGRLCAEVGRRLNNVDPPPRPVVPVPDSVARRRATAATSTQEAFGRTMSALADVPGVGERLVTTSPDVSRRWPVVSVHDAASHTLAWVGAALGVPQIPLGVDRFGESGRIDELRAPTATDTGTVVNAALLALDVWDGA